ncbi:acetylcholinesterase precursor [Phaeosphaeriaceae sp. PMI808]|nr:acetylcholinesterase precursor [Phaeosphaeriaceae sp. PMI808]
MKLCPAVVGGLQSFLLAVLLEQASIVGGTPLPQKDAKADAIAALSQGIVKGFTDSYGNSVFLGIPFADTTGGENRWKAPQDVSKLKKGEVLDATKYGATCPQAISGTTYSQQDEDCLNLNIWVPSFGPKSSPAPEQSSSGVPVFVYMYGGAMVTGSSSNPGLVGTNFARKGVIFVSFNTRESLWAYPNSAELSGTQESQNFGILDVDKALQWVRDNIAEFGGNPDRIVFGGHSSGSVQVDHYLWNHPDTWLAGAVQMSANAKSGPAVAPSNEALDLVAKEVNCPTGKGQLECLRKVDKYALQTAAFNSSLNTYFTPIVDEKTRYQDYASRFGAGSYASHVPLLTGNSDQEGSIFSLVYGSKNSNFSEWIKRFDADVAHIPNDLLKAAYNTSDFSSGSTMSGAQYGDARFFCPVDYFLNMRSDKQNTWAYRFFTNYTTGLPVPGPTHGTEIPYFFGGNEAFAGLSGVTAEQQAFADFQHDWFVSWIKSPAAGPGWEKITAHGEPIAKIGVPGNDLAIENASALHFNARCRKAYNSYLPKYPVIQSIK